MTAESFIAIQRVPANSRTWAVLLCTNWRYVQNSVHSAWQGGEA
ncbi:hypothetical protein [Microvirga splendida]|nr:hypothetical protein [Microvirga splendida]